MVDSGPDVLEEGGSLLDLKAPHAEVKVGSTLADIDVRRDAKTSRSSKRTGSSDTKEGGRDAMSMMI